MSGCELVIWGIRARRCNELSASNDMLNPGRGPTDYL